MSTFPKDSTKTGLPKLRVSVVEYLNTAPLVWGLDTARAERVPEAANLVLERSVPAGCAEALQRGTVDIGIIPAIEYQRIPGLEILPGVSVASEGKVESVLLISKGPVRKARTVALDTSSRTSVALTRILFARHWRQEAEFVDAPPDLRVMLERARAALLIGDPALQFALRARGSKLDLWAKELNLHVYDLGDEWNKMTHLPFVYAVWTVRSERLSTDEERRELARLFQQARDHGFQHLPEIAREAGQALKLPGGELERYLHYSIRYALDERCRAGLELYFRYAHELGLIDEVRPLRFLV